MPDPLPDPLLDVRRLSVQFPSSTERTPSSISLQIHRGEQVLVLGPSGSGKSSLTKAVAGIIPDIVDGDVYGDIDVAALDHRHASVAEIACSVGYLGQDPLDQIALPRVDDEVAFGLENAGVSRDEIGPKVAAALAAVDAAHLAERDTATLSGGQLQRVALAAVLARAPRLLLADEPAAMLDPLAALRVQRLLRHSAPDGRGTLIVDHRLEDASDLPERIVVLDSCGSVVADGATTEVIGTQVEQIAASGCWLPLGAEVTLALGRAPTAEDLADPRAGLDALASVLPSGPSTTRPEPGDVVVHAAGASFSPSRREPPLAQDISLKLRRGTVTAVVGANGSGKTSVLLGLAGLLPTTAGDVRRDGHVGMVLQHPERQFLCRTVEDEIAYGAVDDAIVERLLTEFDLRELRRSNPFQLSGGQQRRLSIAAVVATAAPSLLLDEPTFGQDRAHAIRLAHTISSLAHHSGHAVAIVTHDLRLAGQIADRVVVLRGGRVVSQGPAAEVLRDTSALARHGVGTSRLLRWWADRPELALPALISSLHANAGVT